jgi:hypothetical protein
MELWRDLRGAAIGVALVAVIFYLVHRDEPHWNWSAIEAIGTCAGALLSAVAAGCAVWIASATRRQQVADREHERAEAAVALAFRLRPFQEEWNRRFFSAEYSREHGTQLGAQTWRVAVTSAYVFDAPREIIDAVPELGVLSCRDDILKALQMSREMSEMLHALLYNSLGGDQRVATAFSELRALVKKALDCTAA